MFETVYHGVPIVSLPVFCDHDSNAAKAELDGYAVKLELSTLTAESLLWAIKKVIHDHRYKEEVKRKQVLFRDQKETPLERAVFWTEYVLRNRGAQHFQSVARDLSVFQYYLVDVILVLLCLAWISWIVLRFSLRMLYTVLTDNLSFGMFRKSLKVD